MKIPIALIIPFLCCTSNSAEKSFYPPQVGDTSFNKEIDDPNFIVCNGDKVFQYYNFGKGLQYKGEKLKINEHFKNLSLKSGLAEDSGILIIRFVVNCEGKTGWFRVQEMDTEYQEKKFSKNLVNEVLSLTKSLNEWVIGMDNGNPTDYYQYLAFKFDKGTLMEIIP